MSQSNKRPTLSVLSFPDWLETQPDVKDEECACCGGTGEVELCDDYDNDYYAECKECGGTCSRTPDAPTKRDWISAVRSDARKYRKFTGVIAKMKIAKGAKS